MSSEKLIELPFDRDRLLELRIGERVLLSGPVFTARDATHSRLVAELRETDSLPYDLAGQTLFYAGPTPPSAGRPVGSVGPTTAKRMDTHTPELLEAGIAAMIGKGSRSSAVKDAIVANGAVYFAAVGGSAALLASHVTDVVPVAYEDLGTEALVRMELDRFPVYVAIDSVGGDLYDLAPKEWASTHAEEAPCPGSPR